MAKGLQIRLVKEEPCASPVRDDVVHIRRFRQLPLLQTLLTVGMLKNEASAKRLPSTAVSPLRRGPAYLATSYLSSGFRLGFEFGVALSAGLRMLIAVAFAARHGPMTAGVSAKSKQWHGCKIGGIPARVRVFIHHFTRIPPWKSCKASRGCSFVLS